LVDEWAAAYNYYRVGEQAVEAELELDGEHLLYEVRMVCSGEMKEVLLDAQSGVFLRCACDRSA
jgi:uncharacterized membrane protein YkoI